MAKSKRKDWCSAVKCKCSGTKYPELSFFRFPKDEKRCAEWVQQCGRKDLQGKSVNYLYTNCRICSKHFEQKQILSTGRLVWNAVPTKFKHQKSKPGKRQREKAKEIHERSGPLGQRLKKKLAHLDTVTVAMKEGTVISREPLSKYLTFSEKDIKITDQRHTLPSTDLQSADNDPERSGTDSSQEQPSSNSHISGDNVTAIEMDHSYINQDTELSEGHLETVTEEGVQRPTSQEHHQKALDEIQSSHQEISAGQETPRTASVKIPQDSGSLKPSAISQRVHFQLVGEDNSSQTTCVEVINEEGSYLLLSSEEPQQQVPFRDSFLSTSNVNGLLPLSLPNENSSHSIQKAIQIENCLQEATANVTGMQESLHTLPQNEHRPLVQMEGACEIMLQSECLESQTETNISNVHHEEIVKAVKRPRRSGKMGTSTLRVRLFRAKAKIKKLEAALEEIKRQKSRHKERKKKAMTEVSWSSLTSKKRKPHGRRYSEKHKIFAIGLYKLSHKAYQFCRKELSLPSVRSLQKWMTEEKNIKKDDILLESVPSCGETVASIETDKGAVVEQGPIVIGFIS